MPSVRFIASVGGDYQTIEFNRQWKPASAEIMRFATEINQLYAGNKDNGHCSYEGITSAVGLITVDEQNFSDWTQR